MAVTLLEYAIAQPSVPSVFFGDVLAKYIDRRRRVSPCLWGIHRRHTRVNRGAFCDRFNAPVRLREGGRVFRCDTEQHRYHRTEEAALPCLRTAWAKINGPLGMDW